MCLAAKPPHVRALETVVGSRVQQEANTVRKVTVRDKAASPFKSFQQF